MNIIIYFLTTICLGISPGKGPEAVPAQQVSEYICIGDELIFGKKSIKFSKVISDSRCPKNPVITCIWAGEVKLLLEYFEGNELKSSKIISNSVSELNQFISVAGISIERFEVFPYPEKAEILKQEDYSFKVQISERQ